MAPYYGAWLRYLNAADFHTEFVYTADISKGWCHMIDSID